MLQRKILDSDIWMKPDKWKLIWLYLLLEASHQEYGVLKRGDCLTSYKQITYYTKATKGQVQGCLRWLKKHEKCNIRKSTNKIVISLLNYNKYQYSKNMKNHKGIHTINNNVKNKNIYNNKNVIKSNNLTSIKKLLEEKQNISKNKTNNKNFQQWQDEALIAVKKLQDGEQNKSSIFKCFKQDLQRSRIALKDCEELNKEYSKYFFKIFHIIKKI